MALLVFSCSICCIPALAPRPGPIRLILDARAITKPTLLTVAGANLRQGVKDFVGRS
jgi:hypothetical protein